MTSKAKAKGFVPVPVAVQLQQKRQAIRKLRQSKPVPVTVQRRQHRLAVAKAARVAFPAAGGAGTVKRAKKHGAPRFGGDVACCAAEAVALLTGQDPLELYWSVATDAGSGITIPDAIEAAGVLPGEGACILGLELPEGRHAVLATPGGWWSWGDLYEPWDVPITEAWPAWLP